MLCYIRRYVFSIGADRRVGGKVTLRASLFELSRHLSSASPRSRSHPPAADALAHSSTFEAAHNVVVHFHIELHKVE
jgi:hypothetical protein